MGFRYIRVAIIWGMMGVMGGVEGAVLDVLVPGDRQSEAAHGVEVEFSEVREGLLGQKGRVLLPRGGKDWQGGVMGMRMKVAREGTTYLTVKLSGEEVTRSVMLLYVEGKQVGYRHLGDIEMLDAGTEAKPCPGRFQYRTLPLPEGLTEGKEEVAVEIRAAGPIWGYGRDFGQYQKPMNEAARMVYRLYTHDEPMLEIPEDEVQGRVREHLPVRKEPGEEVMVGIRERVNREIERSLKRVEEPCSQVQVSFLAKAYHEEWTKGYRNELVVKKVLVSVDELFRKFRKDPRLAQAEPSTYNPDWFGLGPSAQAIVLLERVLGGRLDEEIDDGEGGRAVRREAYAEMWKACRDWHRENRRQYTNQSMINDLYGIYYVNRGLAVVKREWAMPEEEAKRYLEESLGMRPWWGSEKDGVPVKPLGDHFLQLTEAGLTRELGYVGTYGEVQDWVAQVYEATKPSPEVAGDEKIRRQVVKIGRARAFFRYPAEDNEGYRAMRMETEVGWRDVHFPGPVAYDQRTTWDGSPFELAVSTMDPVLLGYGKKMLEDGQYFAVMREQLEAGGFRVTAGLLEVPRRYEVVKRWKAGAGELPMEGRGDRVFADEENGVVAVRCGDEILYASLYWRARHGVNFLGKVHLVSPWVERVAVVRQEIRFEDSGQWWVRPNWTNFGFANGGLRYPDGVDSAHAGERLPIARVPEGVGFRPGQENLHAGRGRFYRLVYGDYEVMMNAGEGDERVVVRVGGREVGGVEVVSAGQEVVVAAGTTRVWRREGEKKDR